MCMYLSAVATATGSELTLLIFEDRDQLLGSDRVFGLPGRAALVPSVENWKQKKTGMQHVVLMKMFHTGSNPCTAERSGGYLVCGRWYYEGRSPLHTVRRTTWLLPSNRSPMGGNKKVCVLCLV